MASSNPPQFRVWNHALALRFQGKPAALAAALREHQLACAGAALLDTCRPWLFAQWCYSKFLRAAGDEDIDLVYELVNAGLHTVVYRHEADESLLHVLARFEYLDGVQEALKLGMMPDEVTVHGATPLHYAAKKGAIPIAAELLRWGADVNARDEKRWTPAHYFAVGELAPDRDGFVRLLVAHGADLGAKAANGFTPFDVAYESHSWAAAWALQDVAKAGVALV